MFDHDGIIISMNYLERQISYELKDGRTDFFYATKEFPRMLWIAEIFLMIGMLTKNIRNYQNIKLN